MLSYFILLLISHAEIISLSLYIIFVHLMKSICGSSLEKLDAYISPELLTL